MIMKKKWRSYISLTNIRYCSVYSEQLSECRFRSILKRSYSLKLPRELLLHNSVIIKQVSTSFARLAKGGKHLIRIEYPHLAPN